MLGTHSRVKVPIQTVSEQSVITQSDFITFHIPFNEGDKSPVDATMMAKMKKGVASVKVLPIEPGAARMSFYCGTDKVNSLAGGSTQIYIAP